ncbi:hypothetical protein WBO40_02605 [Lysobacter sp. CCNWLW52]
MRTICRPRIAIVWLALPNAGGDRIERPPSPSFASLKHCFKSLSDQRSWRNPSANA